MGKMIYSFGGGKADGKAEMKNLLGGKGANLAEMAGLGIPVPAGFTITTEVCTYFSENKRKYPAGLDKLARDAMKKVEKIMGANFGDPVNPLLVSVRSGARKSMPGMMETVLNVGLCSGTIPGLIAKTNNPRFVWDAYRRLIMMYSDVVMEKAAGIEPKDGHGIRHQLDHMLDEVKKTKGYKTDADISADDLKQLAADFKTRIKSVLGKEFPDDPWEQLWGGVGAVFASWNGKRAVTYRVIEKIPHEWGTAVNVQAMVFGNMGNSSATGVAFTRNPATGDARFFGEWLVNAQGEDVVAGIRTPNALNENSKNDQNASMPSLETGMPIIYKQLVGIRNKLEKHYQNMQDIEFTIQEGKLWMLQTRDGKRTGPAALKMAVDMGKERLITKEKAITRVTPAQLDELLHPMVDPVEELKVKPIAKGLPAGPGGATGKICFSADRAELKGKAGEKVILVRLETSPEDVNGMHVAEGILTARGGMTSHAALVARGWGKCCIVGCGSLAIDYATRTMKVGDKVYSEGDIITLNGSKGNVYEGSMPLIVLDPTKNEDLATFLKWADKIRALGVRTNADTADDAEAAVRFGAEGIGLFRTEHMFYGKGSEEPLFYLRKMIMSKTLEERKAALEQLFPFVKRDVKATMAVMAPRPVTFRLLDPPLHEFVPQGAAHQEELAKSLNITVEEVKKRGELLHESNPMMGHRGVRLGITYPEVSEMQIRAIIEGAVELVKEGKKAKPEIMIPVTCDANELKTQQAIINKVLAEVKAKYGVRNVDLKVGTMIEIPRACLLANKMAEDAEFFSFGTNDLTQMTYGFSRDDIGGFLNDYLEKKIIPEDPFQTIDQVGTGQLIEMAVTKGRATRPDLKIGICGEQGGDPASVDFCHRTGLTYVSCSPFRVPIARLAAAQAQLANPRGAKKATKPAAKKATKPAAKKAAKKK
ncbi:MAG: pyruvate, phosphate dikinase [Candidatus Sumerlaeota bacterium]|nr:pyruvate, phosphate dikinase [Candidatus Sumerlaeota bacterium]